MFEFLAAAAHNVKRSVDLNTWLPTYDDCTHRRTNAYSTRKHGTLPLTRLTSPHFTLTLTLTLTVTLTLILTLTLTLTLVIHKSSFPPPCDNLCHSLLPQQLRLPPRPTLPSAQKK